MSHVANINSALWSLRVEMVVSTLFPAICWALVRLPAIVCWGIAVIVDMLGVGKFPVLTHHLPSEALPNLYYLSAFLFGAILARNMDVVRAGYRRLNLIAKCLLPWGRIDGTGESPGVLRRNYLL
jgi:peptidoglycan/LPS O-acetylase OafA/YrhL